MSPHELGWIAGILDGEGSISISYNVRRNGREDWGCRIDIAMTHKPTIDRIGEMVGFGNITLRRQTNKKYALVYVWTVSSSSKIIEFLEMVSQCLFTKKEQAEIAIDFCKRIQSSNSKLTENEKTYRIDILNEMRYARTKELSYVSVA